MTEQTMVREEQVDMHKAFVVRFLKRYTPYNAGDVAGLSEYDYKRLSAAGIVELVEERSVRNAPRDLHGTDRGQPWPHTEGHLATDGGSPRPYRGRFS